MLSEKSLKMCQLFLLICSCSRKHSRISKIILEYTRLWKNKLGQRQSQTPFSSAYWVGSANPDSTCPDMTCSDMICSNLTCLDITCPDLTWPDLACSNLACPDSVCPQISCRNLINTLQTISEHPQDTFQTPTRYLPDTFWTLSRPLSSTHTILDMLGLSFW